MAEEWIHFGLSEGHTWVKVHRPLAWAAAWGGYSIDRERKPTGRFSLFIANSPGGFRSTWNDCKKQRVEDVLDAFIDYLPLVAAKLAERRLDNDRKAAIEREKARLRQEAEGRRLAEEQRIEGLLAQLDRWRLARDIREYVAEAATLGADLDPEASWALSYADKVDPLRTHPKADETDER